MPAKAIPTTPSDLPSSTMTTPEYIRIHANASPSKLRTIIKHKILPHDDIVYLKRLFADIGNLDYVFRFLWYDGPKPVACSDDWDITQTAPPSHITAAARHESSSTRGESNWGSFTSSRRSFSIATSQSSLRGRVGTVRASKRETEKSGRTLIQHCCYYNSHQCLRWIFREIVRNHLERVNEEPTQMTEPGSLTRQMPSRQLSEDENLLNIIRQLLEYPSLCYCATHYVAVATLRNSHDCLSLLLEYGGLDPNMPINAHGSTAAHLAAWKNHVDCLRILQSGCYSVSSYVQEDDSHSIGEEWIARNDSAGWCEEENEQIDDAEVSHKGPCSSISSVPIRDIKTWSADWNRTNVMGETPIHVAAREGSSDAMRFFLDLVMSYSEAAAMTDSASDGVEISLFRSCFDDADELNRKDCIGPFIPVKTSQNTCPVDFSARNNVGMDCVALAAMNNHASIIELLTRYIQRINDVESEKNNVDTEQSMSDNLRLNTVSYLSKIPQDRAVTKPPPQSHVVSSHIRRRANSDPISARKHNLSTIPYRPSQSYRVQTQSALPRLYPSLNLNNLLDEHNHETPIHVAARHGSISVIRVLFDGGICNTAARDSLGQTALHIAVLLGRLEVCRFFVELSLDSFQNFDVVDINGRTPLYIACSLGYAAIARLLTPVSNWRTICHERKKSPDGPLYSNVAQQPPLHAAVVNDHLNTVSVLLECGVDVDQVDVNGRTAINAAAKLGYFDMCQMLILNGANVNSRSSRGGPTPFQKAKKYRHNHVAELLYEFGGR